jgi:type II secretory pathway pseudopilin PulG
MIELIFIIVIIGILASVAIPKLAVTKDDAKDAKIKSNVSTCLTDCAAVYTATQTEPSLSISDACGSGVSIVTSGKIVTVSQSLTNGGTYALSGYYKGIRVSY